MLTVKLLPKKKTENIAPKIFGTLFLTNFNQSTRESNINNNKFYNKFIAQYPIKITRSSWYCTSEVQRNSVQLTINMCTYNNTQTYHYQMTHAQQQYQQNQALIILCPQHANIIAEFDSIWACGISFIFSLEHAPDSVASQLPAAVVAAEEDSHLLGKNLAHHAHHLLPLGAQRALWRPTRRRRPSLLSGSLHALLLLWPKRQVW